jgi:uncharacterized protein
MTPELATVPTILLCCVDPLGRLMLGPPRKGPETEAFLASAYHDIPAAIPENREFWMPQRLLEADDRH